MSVRSLDGLSQRLAADLTWRKKELVNLKHLIGSGRTEPYQRKVLLRSAIPILYAHWEGFIKNAGRAYVEYLNNKKVKVKDCSDVFRAQHFRSVINTRVNSGRIEDHLFLLKAFQERGIDDLTLREKDVVATRSNLSSEVFEEIVRRLDIEILSIKTREPVIDDKLLGKRNMIAHGEEVGYSERDFEEVSVMVIAIMEEFRTAIENAAVQSTYRRV